MAALNERLTHNLIRSAVAAPPSTLAPAAPKHLPIDLDGALRSRPARFLNAAVRRILRCPPYRLHCQFGDAEVFTDVTTVPGAMCRAYRMLVKQAAEPLWIEGPWGQTEMTYEQLDEALKLMYVSDRWST